MTHLEELQISYQEGPCITAFEDKVLVGAEDLVSDPRRPSLTPAAVKRASVRRCAVPFPTTRMRWAWSRCCSKSGIWSAEAELALLAFTDLAARLIATVMMGEQRTLLATQRQVVLNSRTVIEQAKGVLIGQQGLSAHAAYEKLRAQARAERRKVAVVAAELYATRSARLSRDKERGRHWLPGQHGAKAAAARPGRREGERPNSRGMRFLARLGWRPVASCTRSSAGSPSRSHSVIRASRRTGPERCTP